MKLHLLFLSLAALFGVASAHAAEPTDSVTVTVAWTLTNTSSNKDAVNSFAIYSDRGFYQYFNSTALNKFRSTKKMPVRVPKQGAYTMIMKYTNRRPAASTMKKFIIFEKVSFDGDSTVEFKGSMCTRHLGFQYNLPGGVPLKFMYRASGKPDDWSEATATQAAFQSQLIVKDQPQYSCKDITSVQYGNSTLGNDRAKCTDIYFNPGISDNFMYVANVMTHMVDTADAGHAADPSKPMVVISHKATLNTTQKETVVSNSGNFRTVKPQAIKRSLYPTQDAGTKWGYRLLFLDTENEAARGTTLTGAMYSDAGEVAYDITDLDPLVLMLHQYETKQVRSLCVESGCGIAHNPLYLTSDGGQKMIMETNVGQGFLYNTLHNNHLFVVKGHPFYSYSPADQKPEYGNTAPFFALSMLASAPADAYSFSYPMNISNGDWVGNAGERRCVDLFGNKFAVIAGNDTIATEWNKFSSALQTFEKTDHDPTDIKIILDNTNFTVDTLAGHSRAVFTYHENDADIVPPTLTMLQLRNKQGRITNKFTSLAEAEIYFNAGDFHRTHPELYMLNSPVTVKAEIASRTSERYTVLQVQDYTANSADFTWGNGYKIDLSQYTHENRDGWFKLRFTLTDTKGNTCVQTISPALYAFDSATGVTTADDDAPFGISLQGTTLSVGAQTPASVQIYGMNGASVMCATGNEFNLSALPAGIYIVRAVAGGAVVTEKIFVR